MKTVVSTLALTLGLGIASAASAVTVSPSVTTWIPGAGVGADPSRYSAANVNDGDADFLALGLGGAAFFNVAGGFTGPITITEITYNLVDKWLGAYTETAKVYAGTSYDADLSSYTLLGSISNTEAVTGATLFTSGVFTWLAILDTTPGSSPSTDGFDIASVTVAPVPLPAAAPLLVAALGGLGIAARRKAKKAA
ncbi:VPLPA-CTERM sorting domain-containing protein [Frigidibacter sp. MR17.14]|uniref:VPLPA-CTERM sorting domain-containing protein n=1 Tax=Frigidibacter sp. MR17.14 TaxID=3126509 RepID=UPI003012D45D